MGEVILPHQGDRITKRRTVLHFASALLAMPVLGIAQTSKTYRLGWLVTISDPGAGPKPFLDAFLAGMRERGYAVGKNLIVDERYSGGDVTKVPNLIDELIALKADVLLGVESVCRIMAARTKTIPIVMVGSVDPVAAGLVKSLSRPGTNVTGMSNQSDMLLGKQIELLTEIAPKMSRLGLMSDATFAGREAYEAAARSAAKAKRLELTIAEARDTQSAGAAFDDLKKRRAEAIVVAGTGPTFFWREAIVAGAARSRLPTAFPFAQYVEIGGLLSYGTNFLASYRSEVPDFVVRIFKGASPAEIPVQQSSKFELVINLKTARDIGLTIPQQILARADRVIQ